MRRVVRQFVVLPGVEGLGAFDFTGQILQQFGIDWLIDPRIPDQYVLCQPKYDINGRKCAEGGSVGIDIVHLREVEPIYIEEEEYS